MRLGFLRLDLMSLPQTETPSAEPFSYFKVLLLPKWIGLQLSGRYIPYQSSTSYEIFW